MGWSKPVLWTGAVAGGVTLAVASSQHLAFAYLLPDLRLVLETSGALIGLALVYLLVGRVRRHAHPGDWWLLLALVVLAGTNITAAIQAAVLSQAAEDAATWGWQLGRSVGALLMAVAAFAGTGRSRVLALGPAVPVLTGAAVVGAATLLAALVGPSLPSLLDETITVTNRPVLVGHPVLLGAHALSAAAFLFAALGFSRRGNADDDALMHWVAAAMLCNSFARINYLMFPSLYSSFVYVGDVLRVTSYLLLAAGATREIRGYWRAQAQAAAAEERRRLARDLHDGLAQELNFLTMQARQLRHRPELASAHVELDRLTSAGDRALDEARRAIDFLVQADHEPLAELLTRTVEEVAERFGIVCTTSVDDDAGLTDIDAEQVMRVVREATINAGRHAKATKVDVEVAHGNQALQVTIRDNGHGFDPAASRGRGAFGLTSMQERAAALGGSLRIESHPDDGTVVTLEVPTTQAGNTQC
jgi:signal transduction histidine kinase